MATGPVFIPDKTPDLRSCSRTRWGNGVDILSGTLKSMLGANRPDGDSASSRSAWRWPLATARCRPCSRRHD